MWTCYVIIYVILITILIITVFKRGTVISLVEMVEVVYQLSVQHYYFLSPQYTLQSFLLLLGLVSLQFIMLSLLHIKHCCDFVISKVPL